VNLDADTRALLASARIGMLALNGGRYPLVNPAAFHHGGDSIWLTTSRHAVKVALARRKPLSSFLVDGGSHCVLLEGEAEVYDPRSVPGVARALMEGPGFYLNLAGYAIKNAAFIGGYLRDLARIPGDWWPQNRALFRLRISRAWQLPSVSSPPAGPAPVPGVPGGVRRSLTRVPVAYICTLVDGVPLMAPALWTADGSISVVTGVAGFLGINRRAAGGIAIESHHAYRATRMVGAYLRGRFSADADAKAGVAERYGLETEPAGLGLRFEPERATWWRGFSVESAEVEQPAARRVAR
jgi:Pyridoxamine 5'-phosphate oxidase